MYQFSEYPDLQLYPLHESNDMAQRKTITYKEKVEILEALDRGELSRQDIASAYQIAIPTLLRIIRSRDAIIQLSCTNGERARVRAPAYADVSTTTPFWALLNIKQPLLQFIGRSTPA